MRPPTISSKPVESSHTIVQPQSNAAFTMIGDSLPNNFKSANATEIFTGVEFVVVSGADAYKHFPVSKDIVTIGRREDQDIVLTDGFVSREHAICLHQGNDWVLQNLSDKGLTINGETSSESIIKHGDMINIGSTVMEFIVMDEAIQRSSQTIWE
jgi:pSer/pThr/pTyr-binding forkhead associated (FHA) protein